MAALTPHRTAINMAPFARLLLAAAICSLLCLSQAQTMMGERRCGIGLQLAVACSLPLVCSTRQLQHWS